MQDNDRIQRCHRILVVEDEPPVLRVLVEAFHSQGFEVGGVSTGEQALELVAAGRHDAMLTDYYLPDMSGVELHQKVRAIDPRLADRTFFMSGSDLSDSLEQYVRSVGLGFFMKPFNATAAARRIAEAVETRAGSPQRRDPPSLDAEP